MSIRKASLKAGIVLVPTYCVAFLTEKMVYVVPMLAASGFFAGAIDLDQKSNRRLVDDDDSDGDEADDFIEPLGD